MNISHCIPWYRSLWSDIQLEPGNRWTNEKTNTGYKLIIVSRENVIQLNNQLIKIINIWILQTVQSYSVSKVLPIFPMCKQSIFIEQVINTSSPIERRIINIKGTDNGQDIFTGVFIKLQVSPASFKIIQWPDPHPYRNINPGS